MDGQYGCSFFLEMIEVLLNLIYATRSGQWDLYVEAVRSTLPWFFAYDRINYSRYLTAHYHDLLALETKYPDIYLEYQKGNFSVQLSNTNTFGKMETDKVIETTINKDTKTPGGTTGKLITRFFISILFFELSLYMLNFHLHFLKFLHNYGLRL